ncbi:hypothetical protein NNRS527_00414 [Nitrosospira sp. NRS527]|nr:hypothetical protein NNRS527_00414 [Nitrosospira sp. NRS527]
MAPGCGGAVPQRLDEFLAFGGVVDGGELLRQIQVIPADNAILDEALAGLGGLLILLFGVQKLPWAANGHSAGEAMHVLDAVEHFFDRHAQLRFVDVAQNEQALWDLAERLEGLVEPVLLGVGIQTPEVYRRLGGCTPPAPASGRLLNG